MSAIQIPRIQAAAVLRPMSSGRTRPCLMLCADEQGADQEVVVKWRAGLDTKETGLICELIAALLASDLDLPVPQPFIVEVAPNFPIGGGQPEISAIAAKSAGLNFGGAKLPPGVGTWPKDKPIPILLRPLAADIFAFDLLIQNPDRRRDNPNLLWSDDEIFICGHEQAFSFLMGVIGWQPPWTGQSAGFTRQHVFYRQLTGLQHDLGRLSGALDALTDARLGEYIEAVPDEWRSNSKAAEEIVDYLRKARENRSA